METLVKINASDYGLEENKAKQISDMFKPMLDKMVELEKEYNEIVKGDISKELCIEAKALRLRYVKVRTGTAAIHQELKQFYLQGGRFVDGWKNAQLMASEGIENKLSSIERHYDILEENRISKLREKRTTELEKYGVEFIPPSLGEMSEDVWDNYLTGTKANYQARIDAEKKAEDERIQKEKEEQLRRFRLAESAPFAQFILGWDDTDFGKMEQGVYDGFLSDAKKKKSEYEAKQEQIRKDNLRLQKEAEEKELKRIAEEKKQQEKAEKERKQHEAELKKIQEENDRIAKELNDKRIAEEKAEAERLVNIEAEKNKGDADKVRDLINDLESLKTKYQFTSQKNKVMYSNIQILLDKVIAHIKK